ncbi:4Fe-4S single cluster domain-containing protein [Aristaeella lactis]|uniref:Anaerobic ribonucleoside-triphosphate reductase activating protein n=1 Tax=Aristaeella lactis TaxID=3046383 RepID=A0AC61PLM8_9FIRM|nr:4Fe-4S single cluster domain-containing protein [Aristaeella lactis]QUA54666.1 radical SAM protein [Aristaeella lactis]SMC63637.1 anaerobic ribonucleoside-triphosphate reductase activating protein [Aristaeella lactis]
MYIARILYPVKVLGPGDRIVIWFAGCEHQCPGCSNPELWDQNERYHTDLNSVMNLINLIVDQHKVDGFTITGGDPFYQPNALKELLYELAKISSDILVYTGYSYNKIKDIYSDILGDIAVLIDGKYIEAENHGSLLRGSDNQDILILNENVRPIYENYLSTHTSSIQNFSTTDGIISVGIHHPRYEEQLLEISKRKGLEVKS